MLLFGGINGSAQSVFARMYHPPTATTGLVSGSTRGVGVIPPMELPPITNPKPTADDVRSAVVREIDEQLKNPNLTDEGRENLMFLREQFPGSSLS